MLVELASKIESPASKNQEKRIQGWWYCLKMVQSCTGKQQCCWLYIVPMSISEELRGQNNEGNAFRRDALGLDNHDLGSIAFIGLIGLISNISNHFCLARVDTYIMRLCAQVCVHGHLSQVLWIASSLREPLLSLVQSCMSHWLRIILARWGKRCPKENDTIMPSHAQSCHFFREVPGFDGNPGGEYSWLKSSSFQKYSAPE